jgi:hypothetical protein
MNTTAERQDRRKWVDPQQIFQQLIPILVTILIAFTVSWFANSAKLNAVEVTAIRQERTSDEIRSDVRDLQRSDRDREVKAAELVSRLEAATQRLDEVLRRLERLEARR